MAGRARRAFTFSDQIMHNCCSWSLGRALMASTSIFLGRFRRVLNPFATDAIGPDNTTLPASPTGTRRHGPAGTVCPRLYRWKWVGSEMALSPSIRAPPPERLRITHSQVVSPLLYEIVAPMKQRVRTSARFAAMSAGSISGSGDTASVIPNHSHVRDKDFLPSKPSPAAQATQPP